MNKKIISLVMVAVLGLCGCGSGGKKTGSGQSSGDSAPVTSSTVESAGLDSFIELANYKGLELTRKVSDVTEDQLFDAMRFFIGRHLRKDSDTERNRSSY